MSDGSPKGTPWTDQEVALIVADYFDMLRMQDLGESFVKSHRNLALQKLTGRSHGSIERKHQNISAVLHKFGRNWLKGYPPLPNVQRALAAEVGRVVETLGESFLTPPFPTQPELADVTPLYFGPPPTVLMQEKAESAEFDRLVRKFNPAERDARNRTLGRSGEERVLFSERARLHSLDRDDLAKKVRWVSEVDGDGAGYDILSFEHDGGERLLEVKTTTGHQATPFYLTENERSLSEERPDAFRLVRLYDFSRTPKAFELVPPLEQSVMLQPTNYRASFGAR